MKYVSLVLLVFFCSTSFAVQKDHSCVAICFKDLDTEMGLGKESKVPMSSSGQTAAIAFANLTVKLQACTYAFNSFGYDTVTPENSCCYKGKCPEPAIKEEPTTMWP